MEAPATAEFPGPGSNSDIETAFEGQSGQSQAEAAPEAVGVLEPAAAAAEPPPFSAAQAPRSDQQHHLPAATSQGHHSGAEGGRAEPSSSSPASESGAKGLSSRYLGVSWNGARGRWTAKIANGRVVRPPCRHTPSYCPWSSKSIDSMIRPPAARVAGHVRSGGGSGQGV